MCNVTAASEVGEVLGRPLLPFSAPFGSAPVMMRRWFDESAAATIPDCDGTLQAAPGAADAYTRKSKANNTRRVYRAGVRAWYTWCDTHGLPCLPT